MTDDRRKRDDDDREYRKIDKDDRPSEPARYNEDDPGISWDKPLPRDKDDE